MSAEAQQILEAAMRLPNAVRAELAAILTDSIGDGSSEEDIEAAWVAEAKRRLEEVRSGKVEPVPFENVSRKLRAMVEQARLQRAAAG